MRLQAPVDTRNGLLLSKYECDGTTSDRVSQKGGEQVWSSDECLPARIRFLKQAYYQGSQPSPNYFNPASPSPQHYMWTGQHMMPPYGTPPTPYGGMFPYGAQQPYMNFGMPSPGPELVGQTGNVGQEEDKSTKAKNSTPKLPIVTPSSANKQNNGFSQSGEEEKDDDEEDDDDGEDEPGQQMPPMEGASEFWSQQDARDNMGQAGKKKRERAAAPQAQNLGVPQEMWLQDEREVKKQRRKQSNRESARRSRLRKQAECEELGGRVDTLLHDNSNLKREIKRYKEESQRLQAINDHLQEQLRAELRKGTFNAQHSKSQDLDTQNAEGFVHDRNEGEEGGSHQMEKVKANENQARADVGGDKEAQNNDNSFTQNEAFHGFSREENEGLESTGPDTIAAG